MAPRRYLLCGDTIPVLIKEVQARPCLWNSDDENYNDRYYVLSAWKDIAALVDTPEDILKTKWKNLRDLFRRELKKCDALSIEDYKGRWRHFKSLWFLHKTCTIVTTNDSDDVEEIEDETNPLEPFVKFEPLGEAEDENTVYLDEDEIPEKKTKYTDDDYDMMYLKSLTPYFSQLDPIRKLVVRSKIQDILLNEIAAQKSASRMNSLKK